MVKIAKINSAKISAHKVIPNKMAYVSHSQLYILHDSQFKEDYSITNSLQRSFLLNQVNDLSTPFSSFHMVIMYKTCDVGKTDILQVIYFAKNCHMWGMSNIASVHDL